jgi:hypothetical protein
MPKRSIVVAALGVLLGTVFAAMRLHHWAIDTFDWFVAASSIVPGVAALATFIAGIIGFFGRIERPMKQRVGTTGLLVIASVGYAFAAWGLRGARVSLNPFDTTLTSIDGVPDDHSILLAIDSSDLDVVDLTRDHVFRLVSGRAMLAGDLLRAAWWDEAQHRLLFRSSAGIDAVTLDGRHTTLFTLELEDDTYTDDCVLLDSRALGCVVAQRDVHTSAWHVSTRVRRLDGGAEESVEWSTPPDVPAHATMLHDGSAVVFADRCEGAEPESGDECLYRAARDGSARSLIGALGGELCAIAISRDDSTAVVASPCTRVRRVDITHGSIEPIADFVPEGNWIEGHGARSLAFSPDGERIAVLSDYIVGCTGDWGDCNQNVVTLRIDGSERHLVAGWPIATHTLLWIQ